MKMKLAVVLGVAQMLVGLLLRFTNAMYEKNMAAWFCGAEVTGCPTKAMHAMRFSYSSNFSHKDTVARYICKTWLLHVFFLECSTTLAQAFTPNSPAR